LAWGTDCTIAIIEYLDEAYNFEGGASLLPRHPLQRARARQIAEIINSGIQPLHNVSFLRQVKAVQLVGGALSEDSKVFGVDAIQRGLAAIEAIIAPVAPPGSGTCVVLYTCR
jgi:maleylpyruvate isomerase